MIVQFYPTAIINFLLLAIVVALVGCSSSQYDPFIESGAEERYADYVPPSAVLMASGNGRLAMKAPADGTAILLDSNDLVQISVEGMKRLYFEEPIVQKPRRLSSWVLEKDAKLVFDPGKKTVVIDGVETAPLSGIDPGHEFELFFDPATPAK